MPRLVLYLKYEAFVERKKLKKQQQTDESAPDKPQSKGTNNL